MNEQVQGVEVIDGVGKNELDVAFALGGRKGDPIFGHMGSCDPLNLPKAALIEPYQDVVQNSAIDSYGAVIARNRFKNKSNRVQLVYTKMRMDDITGQAIGTEVCKSVKLPFRTDKPRENPLLRDGVSSELTVRMLAMSMNNGVLYYMREIPEDQIEASVPIIPQIWNRPNEEQASMPDVGRVRAQNVRNTAAQRGGSRNKTVSQNTQPHAQSHNGPPEIGGVRAV